MAKKQPISETGQYNFNFIASVKNGNFEEFRRLLPLADPTVNNSLPLLLAVRHGHAAMVEALLPVSTDSAIQHLAMKPAIENNRNDIIQLLLPLIKSEHLETHFLQAVKTNNLDIVQSFLLYTSAENNARALALAAVDNHTTIVDELMRHSNYHETLNMYKNHLPHKAEDFQHTIEEHEHREANELKDKIVKELNTVPSHSGTKRKM